MSPADLSGQRHKYSKDTTLKKQCVSNDVMGAAVVEWLSSWLAEKEVWGSIPGLAT